MLTVTQQKEFTRSDIDKGRKSLNVIREKVSGLIEGLLNIKSREEFLRTINNLFPKEGEREGKGLNALSKFFIEHPSAWYDFIRKIHKYKGEKDELTKYSKKIDEQNARKIMETILIKGRKPDKGKQIVDGMNSLLLGDTAISKHTRNLILDYSEKQKSLLDISGRSILSIPESSRKDYFMRLIKAGLQQNIDGCKDDNDAEKEFRKVFPRLLEYLEKIFGKSFSGKVKESDNILGLASLISIMFKAGDYGDGWMLIQAFHAWANINKIIGMAEESANYCKPNIFREFLSHSGIVLHDNPEQKKSSTGVTVYEGNCTINGVNCIISWRPKSVESILQKMWQKEDYNNHDTLRDTVGITISIPDDTDINTELAIIKTCTLLLPEYGYIFKDKGYLKEDQRANLTKAFQDGSFQDDIKRPVSFSQEKNSNTLDDIDSVSLAGFFSIKKNRPIGGEIQIMKQSTYVQKKDDDFNYKIRGGIESLCRGPKYILPSELYNFLSVKFGQDEMNNKRIVDHIKLLIDTKVIIPYVYNNRYIYFTHKNYSEAIEDDIKKAEKVSIDTDNETKGALWKYIEDIDKFRMDVIFSKPETSLRPPSPDR